MRTCVPGAKVGLELVPELGRLIADVPEVVLVARREIALLGAAPLFVRASAHDDAVVRLVVGIDVVGARLQVQALARSSSPARCPSARRASGCRSSRRGSACRDDRRAGAAWRGTSGRRRWPLRLGPPPWSACTPWPGDRDTRSSRAACSWYRYAPAGTARARRRPCGPATTARSSLCRSTRACKAARSGGRPHAGCRRFVVPVGPGCPCFFLNRATWERVRERGCEHWPIAAACCKGATRGAEKGQAPGPRPALPPRPFRRQVEKGSARQASVSRRLRQGGMRGQPTSCPGPRSARGEGEGRRPSATPSDQFGAASSSRSASFRVCFHSVSLGTAATALRYMRTASPMRPDLRSRSPKSISVWWQPSRSFFSAASNSSLARVRWPAWPCSPRPDATPSDPRDRSSARRHRPRPPRSVAPSRHRRRRGWPPRRRDRPPIGRRADRLQRLQGPLLLQQHLRQLREAQAIALVDLDDLSKRALGGAIVTRIQLGVAQLAPALDQPRIELGRLASRRQGAAIVRGVQRLGQQRPGRPQLGKLLDGGATQAHRLVGPAQLQRLSRAAQGTASP